MVHVRCDVGILSAFGHLMAIRMGRTLVLFHVAVAVLHLSRALQWRSRRQRDKNR